MGETLVAEKDSTLPSLCVFSGEPVEGQGQRVRQKLAWAPPALAALVLISPLIYVIVYLIVRKTGTLDYALSQAARRRRTNGVLLALGGIALAIALFVVGANAESPPAMLAALVVFMVGLVWGVVRARVLQLTKIDQTHIHLKLPPTAAQAFAAAAARYG